MSPAPADPTLLTRLLTRAVDAAARADADGFGAATADLAAFDAEQARVVLGWVLRRSLEEQHPDGLDADDLRAAVTATAGRAGWFAELDPRVLVVVLVAALGEHPDPEEVPRLGHTLVLAHALLLVHDLATGPGRPLRRALDPALAEVRRAETMEMP
ncbi:hypothetical protein AB2L28_02820 [Kineococcus sp. TBRC 1896]|uniref:Uncharacterized protein n=1 Tax=Kineococcus mangrovi TaxID=1660183 RepID=A0ABV4HXN3_9ACTN